CARSPSLLGAYWYFDVW
nr:immunoglobulin heavy chain junction region [Mus musculus]